MPVIRHVTPRNGDVVLLVGTMKGAFIVRSDAGRRDWDVGGPYFPGSAVYALAADMRAGRHRIWAGPHSMHWGGMLRCTDDFGKTWTNPEAANVKFPEGTGAALQQIWQIAPGRDSEADTLYCGVEPAALFVSRDAGGTWSLVEGLWNHPQRPKWQPGGGGLCLHTILLDPERLDRIRIAVSSAGMYATDDGGATWRPSNHGVRADFLPEKYPEFGQCVHKVVQAKAPARSDVPAESLGPLPQRRSRRDLDRHRQRRAVRFRVRDGDPSGEPGVRVDRAARVRRVPLHPRRQAAGLPHARRAARTGTRCRSGLPQEGAYETVLRDALTVDTLATPGVYFGTRSGKLFGSADEGETWSAIADGLPPVIAVKAAVV